MNTFMIDGKTFEAPHDVRDTILIKSHPKHYNVVFERFIPEFEPNQVVLIDANVQKLFNINHDKMIVIESIEENKSIETVLGVCKAMLDYGFDKGHTLVVIGGGIVQDIGAFTAKIFKRGINWIYVPTTLLSQCDSCIGGKTALNFMGYKNQLALFSAPSKVIIDTHFLSSLSKKDILSGYGEIVKLFITGGKFYTDNIDKFDIKTAIFHALVIKKAVVEYDEFENNERKSLNYGHTFGHAIESAMNYEIPHGEAVILGIEIINRLYGKNQQISELTDKFTSLNKLVGVDVNKIIEAMKNDKKMSAGKMSFVVVPEIGKTVFVEQTLDSIFLERVNEVFTN